MFYFNMTSSHMYINQVSYLNPLFEALRHSGVNLEKIKNKSELKYFDINNTDSYVPVKLLDEFLVNIYEQEGLTNLDRTDYIVPGTFEFKTATQDCDIIQVSDGRFDLHYYPY